MKVLIELPDNWLDADNMQNLDWIVKTVRQEVRAQVVKALVEQVDLPEVHFTPFAPHSHRGWQESF